MAKIRNLRAYPVNDSRGVQTIEVEIELENGYRTKASVPSGVSSGNTSDVHLVDPMAAIRNIESDIAPKLIGDLVMDQLEIDGLMNQLDGTPNKYRLGANATLAVSLAAARAIAHNSNLPLYRYIGRIFDDEQSIKLPVPMFNAINGGQHADNNLDYQEFMAVPISGRTFEQKLEMGIKIFDELKRVLEKKALKTRVGDEGGYAPDLDTNEMALGLMVEAIEAAGYKAGKDVFLSLDVAASYLPPTFQMMTQHYIDIITNYPIISIEDPLPADDWHWWAQLNTDMIEANKKGKNVYLVGDDIFATNLNRFRQGINERVGNAILVKINQAGTLSEILDVIRLAKTSNYECMISHRAGETLDTFISDLAVGVGAGFVKAGAPNSEHQERMVKYQRLVDIEKELLGT